MMPVNGTTTRFENSEINEMLLKYDADNGKTPSWAARVPASVSFMVSVSLAVTGSFVVSGVSLFRKPCCFGRARCFESLVVPGSLVITGA